MPLIMSYYLKYENMNKTNCFARMLEIIWKSNIDNKNAKKFSTHMIQKKAWQVTVDHFAQSLKKGNYTLHIIP